LTAVSKGKRGLRAYKGFKGRTGERVKLLGAGKK
jgi:hypothetical protein